MMKKSAILLLLLFAALAAGAQPFYRKPVAPVRNVIVMIPDGTSTSVLAAARWYKFYNDPSPLICFNAGAYGIKSDENGFTALVVGAGSALAWHISVP